MNAPDRYELFVLPDGVRKISITHDTKILNAATFRIEKEDHTLANSIRMKLLENPNVLFAGYKVPHPLDYAFLIKIQTKSTITPLKALSDAISACIQDVTSLEERFKSELSRLNVAQ